MAKRPFNGASLMDVENHRVSLPSNIHEFIPWFDGTRSLDCLWIPGLPAGMAIFPPSELKAREEIRRRIESIQLTPRQLGSLLAEAALAARVGWPITIQKQGRVRLPALAREMDLVPQEPTARIWLAAYGGVLHFGKPDKVLDELRPLIGRWGELEAAIPDAGDEDEDGDG